MPTDEVNPNFFGNHELEANRRCSIIPTVDLNIAINIYLNLQLRKRQQIDTELLLIPIRLKLVSMK